MGRNSVLTRSWKWQRLLVPFALGCGGGASDVQAPQQQWAPASANAQPNGAATTTEQSNASSLVVAMSMVLPKKPITPPTSTAPALPQQAAGAAAPITAPGMGMVTQPPMAAGAAGAPAASTMSAAAGGGAPPGSAAGAEISGVPEAELAMLRELCVSELNMYRATLPDKMLMPLKRATPEQEECSQRGAMMDGDTMQGHGAFRAGLCSSVGLSAQNSCPGYPVGGFGGGGTIADSFKTCMAQMWAEGEPPVPRQQCMQDTAGCFQMHGHYLNMTDPNYTAVSCSFYKMKDGRSYWMSQDFAYGGGFGGWMR